MNDAAIRLDQALIGEMLGAIGADATRDLAAFYADETRGRVPELRRFLETGAFPDLKRSAHSLKGASRTYGIVTLADVAARLEKAAGEENAAEARPALAWIEEHAERALKTLFDYLDAAAAAG